MPSSTSDSNLWQKFVFYFLGVAGSFIFFIWLFIVLIDPWGMLPLSLPFMNRIPISTNARYSFPALSISKQFNSAIIGTSTSRLLQPTILNGAFHTSFVNLSMNASTPWEQEKMLALFVKHHPNPKVVILNMDAMWCFIDPHYSNRPFPEWMYEGSPWKGYLKMANQYALQEAFNQFAWLVGLKKQRYGSDGFTPLLPDNFVYMPEKVDKAFKEWVQADNSPVNGRVVKQPALKRLQHMVDILPTHTIKIIFIPPFSAELYGKKGGWSNVSWSACKANFALIAKQTPNTIAIDFAIPNKITQQRSNFVDPIHYREFIATIIMDGLVKATLHRQELPDQQDKIIGYYQH